MDNYREETLSKYAQTVGYVIGNLRVYISNDMPMPVDKMKELFEMLDTKLWNRIHDKNTSPSDLFKD